jgi:hypothetical protein
VFEFEDQECEDGSLAENEVMTKFAPEAFSPVPAVISPVPESRRNLVPFQSLYLVNALSQQLLTVGAIVSVFLFYFLYL